MIKKVLTSILGLVLLTGLLSAQTTVPTASAEVELGKKVTLTASSDDGTAPFTYVWSKAGVVLPGATASTFVIARLALADIGTYSVTIKNSAGQAIAAADIKLLIIAPTKVKIVITVTDL